MGTGVLRSSLRLRGSSGLVVHVRVCMYVSWVLITVVTSGKSQTNFETLEYKYLMIEIN